MEFILDKKGKPYILCIVAGGKRSPFQEPKMANASAENYYTTDTCDGCGERKRGTMFHAEGATGRICPVLFLCYPCQGKPEPAPEAEKAPEEILAEGGGDACEGCTESACEGCEHYEPWGDEEPWDGFNTDAEADADVLASAGWGCDEDYGCFGDDGGW